VWGAICVLVGAWVLWPQSGRPGDVAWAAWQCGAGDAYRATLTLYGGAGTLKPCVAGVTMNLTVPDNTSDVRYRIEKVRVVDTFDLPYANGTTGTGLVHIAFESFTIANTVSGVALTSTDGPGYTLGIQPDHQMVIGGVGVNTDLWVTSDSWIRIDDNMAGFGCFLIAFAVNPCKVTVGAFSSLSWLLDGSSYNGYGMHLDIKFLATYRADGGATTGSIQLPDTTVTVS
jgi:hypothetical protein